MDAGMAVGAGVVAGDEGHDDEVARPEVPHLSPDLLDHADARGRWSFLGVIAFSLR